MVLSRKATLRNRSLIAVGKKSVPPWRCAASLHGVRPRGCFEPPVPRVTLIIFTAHQPRGDPEGLLDCFKDMFDMLTPFFFLSPHSALSVFLNPCVSVCVYAPVCSSQCVCRNKRHNFFGGGQSILVRKQTFALLPCRHV